MSRFTVNINVQAPTGLLSLKLLLDPAKLTQQAMIGSFQQNSLYEPETSELLANLLQPGDTFLDVGGHVGYFTTLAAGIVGPTGAVFTFEPERSNYEQLLAHISANNFQNVIPFPWAVGGQQEVVDFFINLDNDGGHALWNPGTHPFNKKSLNTTTRVPTFQTTLDRFFSKSSIKLIKIDVEGNELQVLHGAREMLSTGQVAAVVLEINKFGLNQRSATEDQVRAFMTERNYQTYLLQAWPPTLLAPDQHYDSPYVFNLLFINPQLQARVASVWPQSYSPATQPPTTPS